MPRISLWNPNKGTDYKYADEISSEITNTGGAGILVHKYLGSGDSEDVTEIQDVLFLENRDRRYSQDVIEMRGHFQPVDTDYDLSQFGIFLSSEILRFDFHYTDMINMLGRKMMAGDVFEVPAQRDISLDGVPVNSYYVVQDAMYSASGHSMTWYPHFWKVRAKKLDASPEFQDIIDSAATKASIGNEGQGTGIVPDSIEDWLEHGDPEARNALDKYVKYLGITDGVVDEAEKNVYFDPKYFNAQHLYVVTDENGYPQLHYWFGGDGQPPNGNLLRGVGETFPSDMQDGEYFLRIDYSPDRLFQKQGNTFKRIEDDIRKIWTAYNKRLDTYINNNQITSFDDGVTVPEKTSTSSVAESRTDLDADKKQEVEQQQQEEDSFIARKIGNVGQGDNNT